MKKVADALISERKYGGILTGNPTADLAHERPSNISMPHVASNVLGQYAAKQLARAVQVGRYRRLSQDVKDRV